MTIIETIQHGLLHRDEAQLLKGLSEELWLQGTVGCYQGIPMGNSYIGPK